jgi:hypothetical protein
VRETIIPDSTVCGGQPADRDRHPAVDAAVEARLRAVRVVEHADELVWRARKVDARVLPHRGRDLAGRGLFGEVREDVLKMTVERWDPVARGVDLRVVPRNLHAVEVAE